MPCRLDDAISAAVEVISKAMEEQFERTKDVNEKRIQLKCGDIQRRAEVCNINARNVYRTRFF